MAQSDTGGPDQDGSSNGAGPVRMWVWVTGLAALVLMIGVAGSTLQTRDAMPGFLSIEPPQVYTRERLVNDRFREATWLNLQLQETHDPATRDRFARASRGEATQRSVAITATAAASATAEAPAVAMPQAPITGDTVLDELRLFERRALYRERLRNDLMDTLLDDGHDLDGNTLYRLNFDAVAMPWADRFRRPGSAIFVIEMLPHDREGASAQQEEAYLRKLILDELDMFGSWQRSMQVFLSKVLSLRIRDFENAGRLENPVDPKEPIAFDRYLRLQVIEEFLRLAAEIGTSLECGAAQKAVMDGIADQEQSALADTEFCRVWSFSPLQHGDEAEDIIARRMAYLAEMSGFHWRPDNRVPDAASQMTVAGLLKGLRVAHAVNQLHVEASPPRLASTALTAYPRDPRARQGLPPEEQLRLAHLEGLRSGLPAVMMKLRDPEMKRATFRLLTMLRSVSGAAPIYRQGAADLDQTPSAVFDIGIPDGETGRPDQKLWQFLGGFETLQPGDEDLATFADGLVGRNAVYLKPLQHDRGADAPQTPKLKIDVPPHDICLAAHDASGGGDALFAYGRCMFLRLSNTQEVQRVLAQFLLDRIRGDLPGYESIDVAVTDFLNVRLSGCDLTGCRIEVLQHEEFVGGLIGMDTPVGDDSNPMPLFAAAEKAARPLAETVLTTKAKASSSPSMVFSVAELRAAQRPFMFDALNEHAGGLDGDHPTRVCLERARIARDISPTFTPVEVYLACRLRLWVEEQRSPLAVYGISPRIAGPVVEGSSDQSLSGSLAGQSAGTGAAGIGAAQRRAVSATEVDPEVIGFSDLSNRGTAGSGPEAEDRVVFGWALRARRDATGTRWAPSHQRLSAVVAVPSWWKWMNVRVRACWVSPADARALGRDLVQNPEHICNSGPDASGDRQGLSRDFMVQLPRRVDDIVERFNFDFIEAPYFDRDWVEQVNQRGSLVTMEVGRPGRLVLAGERLWRGTVVTLNNQNADAIVVLPDMKGVIAEFRCVQPPPGQPPAWSDRPEPQQTEASDEASVRVWTSEGRTDIRNVTLTPFVQRTPNDTPCDPANPEQNPIDRDTWDKFLATVDPTHPDHVRRSQAAPLAERVDAVSRELQGLRAAQDQMQNDLKVALEAIAPRPPEQVGGDGGPDTLPVGQDAGAMPVGSGVAPPDRAARVAPPG